jgi:ABC-type branched-subunit amino acid transport system substrate-binding protein
MFPTKGPLAAAFGTMARDGVDLARHEIDVATAPLEGDHRVPPIAVVACDDGTEPVRAARHLVDDVGVQAIVGFRSGQEIVDIGGSLLIPRGVLVVAPVTASPVITRLPQPPGPRLVWRTTFSMAAVADATAALVHDVLEPRLKTNGRTRVALARSDTSMALAFAERFYERLAFNGKSAMANGHDYLEVTYPPSADQDALDRAARDVAGQRPSLVVLSADATAAMRIVSVVESAWSAGSSRPTYVLTSASTAILAPWIDGRPDRRRRVFGIDSASDSPENARFVIRYNQTHTEQVTRTVNPSASYDALYLVAYAAFAQRDKPKTGPSLAAGIARLVGPGPHVTTGPIDVFTAVSALTTGGAIDLQGTASGLDFDLATGEAPADFVLLCPAERGPDDDTESGVVYRAREQTIEGTLRCP